MTLEVLLHFKRSTLKRNVFLSQWEKEERSIAVFPFFPSKSFYAAFLSNNFYFSCSPGWMTPQEMRNLKASSKETSTGIMTWRGGRRTKPDMGRSEERRV